MTRVSPVHLTRTVAEEAEARGQVCGAACGDGSGVGSTTRPPTTSRNNLPSSYVSGAASCASAQPDDRRVSATFDHSDAIATTGLPINFTALLRPYALRQSAAARADGGHDNGVHRIPPHISAGDFRPAGGYYARHRALHTSVLRPLYPDSGPSDKNNSNRQLRRATSPGSSAQQSAARRCGAHRRVPIQSCLAVSSTIPTRRSGRSIQMDLQLDLPPRYPPTIHTPPRTMSILYHDPTCLVRPLLLYFPGSLVGIVYLTPPSCRSMNAHGPLTICAVQHCATVSRQRGGAWSGGIYMPTPSPPYRALCCDF